MIQHQSKSVQRQEKQQNPFDYGKCLETGKLIKSLFLFQDTFFIQGIYFFSPVPRHFLTDVGSGPLWAEPEIEKLILGHEKVKIPWIRRQMTRVQNCENAMVVILIVSGWTASLVQERESWRRRRRPRASKRTLTPLPRMSSTWPGSVRDSFLEQFWKTILMKSDNLFGTCLVLSLKKMSWTCLAHENEYFSSLKNSLFRWGVTRRCNLVESNAR